MDIGDGHRRWGRTHTFGFFNKREDVDKAITKYGDDMYECLYTYIVVEHLKQGVRPWTTQRAEIWYKWQYKTRSFKLLKHKPKEFLGSVGWSMG